MGLGCPSHCSGSVLPGDHFLCALVFRALLFSLSAEKALSTGGSSSSSSEPVRPRSLNLRGYLHG